MADVNKSVWIPLVVTVVHVTLVTSWGQITKIAKVGGDKQYCKEQGIEKNAVGITIFC